MKVLELRVPSAAKYIALVEDQEIRKELRAEYEWLKKKLEEIDPKELKENKM